MHVYGACGATDGTISGCAFHLAMKSRARASESSKLAASGAGNFSTVCAHSARIPASAAAVGDRLFEVIHVGEAGRAGSNHLGAREACAERHEVRPHELAFDGHHVAHQPDVESEVVGHAAQQRHRGVRVGVHQAGHHDAPGAIDRVARVVVGFDGADSENLRAGDRNRPPRMHGEALVHRQDMRIGEQEVAGRAHRCLIC